MKALKKMKTTRGGREVGSDCDFGQFALASSKNFIYYMPARQAPHGYNLPMQQQFTGYAEVSSAAATPLSHNQAPQPAYATNRLAQSAPKSELPSGVYRTTSSGNPQATNVF